MKFKTLLKLIRFWPPFLGAGARVSEFNADCTVIKIEMKKRFWNTNYVGSQFGGSLYSITDPFYMLMLMKHLGKDYIVWDKVGTIRYKKPAYGKVFATFEISPAQIEEIRQQVEKKSKYEPEFAVKITDGAGEVIAEVSKVLYVRKK